MTEQQKRDNIVYGITDNIFVEAGAGAGKTTLITRRIVNQLRSGIRPEHLVVITFTNAAAGELYGRIAKALNEELTDEKKKQTLSVEQKERLQYALEHMDRMTISTIHSFCHKLLKERCFDATLPMEMELLEPLDAAEYQLESFKSWLRGLTRAELTELQEASVFYSDKKFFREWLEMAFLKLCDKPEDVRPVTLSSAELAAVKQEILNLTAKKAQAEQTLEQEIAALGAFLVQKVNQMAKKSFQTAEEIYDAGLLYSDAAKNYGGIFKSLKSEKKRKLLTKLMTDSEALIYKKGRSKADQAVSGPINADFKNMLCQNQTLPNVMLLLEQIEKELAEKTVCYFYFVLLKYAILATAEYKKGRTGRYVTNDELLQRAKELVCGSASARAYFAERYQHIYVDEFQDTDHVQAELIWRLCCGEEGKLRKGSLFVVGDPKQAIYRFRGGEPAVYYDIKARMTEQGAGTAVYELGDNHRSNQEMIDWINAEFKKAIEGYGGSYTAMQCKKGTVASQTGLLKGVFSCDSGVGSLKKNEEKAKAEAKVLANLVQTLVQKSFLVAPGKENKIRRIKYQDFLILCWKMDDMKYYLKEFRRRGIPVEFSGRMELTNQRVLNSFCRLYRYLASKGDRKAKEGAYPVLVQGVDAVTDEPLADVRLKQLTERTKGMDGYALAQYLIAHPEYVVKWDVVLQKEELYTIQVLLRQMVETVCQTKRGTATELAEEFCHYVERGMERELPLTMGQNAVRFMNLHKAKGLEGTITILTNRQAYSENRPTPELQEAVQDAQGMFPYYGTLRKYNEYAKKMEELTGYDKFPDALETAWEEEEAENTRLEYVAATRAKESLIVMSAYGEPVPFERYEIPEENSIENFITEAVCEWEKEQENNGPATGGTASGMSAPLVPTDYIPQQQKIPVELLEKGYISLSPSQLESHTASGEEEDTEQQTTEKRPKGKVFGTVMHRSFELLVTFAWENVAEWKNDVEKTISSCVCQAIMEQAEELLWEGKRLYFKKEETDEDYLVIVRDYLLAALQRFIDNGTLEALLTDAAEVYTELPFSYYIYPEKEQELLQALKPHLLLHGMEDALEKTIWVNGTADLIIRRKDGMVQIVDYKSDSIRNFTKEGFEEVLKQRYEGQMLLYRHSMGRLFSVDPETIKVKLQHLY